MRFFLIVRTVLAVLVLGTGLFAGARRINQLPPLGPLLDPAHGIWSVARVAELPKRSNAVVGGLGDAVDIVYDRRGVPHIEATSVEDAVRALGYVVARDRLFQLELQARAAAGRLTEWVGETALAADRHQRSIGLSWSAEEEQRELDPTSELARFGLAYAAGVNAWIDGMREEDLPFEYKLLGVEPQRWEPVHSVLTYKRMGYTLAYSTHERWRQRVAGLVGREATAALFPTNSPIQEPIQPNGRGNPRFDFRQIPPPPEPESRYTNEVIALDHAGFGQMPTGIPLTAWGRGMAPATAEDRWHSRVISGITTGRRLAGVGRAAAPGVDRQGREVGSVGSNNWAVSPARSATGNALLSGDPHLGLSLPSIWYEVHITVPGEMDVYGVTIPGIPCIVIGFNRDVAWSFTNTGADVLDYYWETVDDPTKPARYLIDGEWRELERRIEYYRRSDGGLLATDTLFATHRGPLVFTDDGPLSMRWTVLDDPPAIGSFFGAARSRSIEDFGRSMESYLAPAQNMIVADRAGNIAIRSTGRFPIRPDYGDGTEIRDGSTSASDWVGYWKLEEYPGGVNPDQGFLASANQQPIDPQVSARYLGADWPDAWRAMRINEILRKDSAVTVEAMSKYHTDPANEKADIFVPAFLEAAERVLANKPDARLADAARLLGEWDRLYTKDNERAVLFETALGILTSLTWDELVPAGSSSRVATPSESVLASLLGFADDLWWDHQSTRDVIETRDDILTVSLADALEQVTAEYGPPDEGGWRWDGIRHANIYHLLGLAPLSVTGLPIQGGSGNLNPSSGSGTHGASWRMVVEMGDSVRAWATYPGGQSGNPVSSLYKDRVQQWVDGTLEEVFFPVTPHALPDSDILAVLTLAPEGN